MLLARFVVLLHSYILLKGHSSLLIDMDEKVSAVCLLHQGEFSRCVHPISKWFPRPSPPYWTTGINLFTVRRSPSHLEPEPGERLLVSGWRHSLPQGHRSSLLSKIMKNKTT